MKNKILYLFFYYYVLHHAKVFVVENMAVKYQFTGEVQVPGPDSYRTSATVDKRGISPERVNWFAVPFNYLERIGMYMKIMDFGCVVD